MSPRGWALFAAVSVVWGVPYLFIKIAVDEACRRASWRGRAWRWPRWCCCRSPGDAAPCAGCRCAGWPPSPSSRSRIPFPLIALRRAAHLVVAGGDPDRRACRWWSPFLALRFDHAERPTPHPPRRDADRARRAWRRWWASTSAAAAPSCVGAAAVLRGHVRLRVRPADRQAPADRRRPARSGRGRARDRVDHPAAARRSAGLPDRDAARTRRSRPSSCWASSARRSPSCSSSA